MPTVGLGISLPIPQCIFHGEDLLPGEHQHRQRRVDQPAFLGIAPTHGSTAAGADAPIQLFPRQRDEVPNLSLRVCPHVLPLAGLAPMQPDVVILHFSSPPLPAISRALPSSMASCLDMCRSIGDWLSVYVRWLAYTLSQTSPSPMSFTVTMLGR